MTDLCFIGDSGITVDFVAECKDYLLKNETHILLGKFDKKITKEDMDRYRREMAEFRSNGWGRSCVENKDYLVFTLY